MVINGLVLIKYDIYHAFIMCGIPWYLLAAWGGGSGGDSGHQAACCPEFGLISA